MGTKVFWQFIFRAIMTAIETIHGHMTSKMGVATKGHACIYIDQGISTGVRSRGAGGAIAPPSPEGGHTPKMLTQVMHT